MSKEAPCKNCSERHYGCHAECDRYVSYSESRRAELDRRIKANENERGYIEHSCRLDHRIRRNSFKSKIIRSPKR